jgi:hypothetical protein
MTNFATMKGTLLAIFRALVPSNRGVSSLNSSRPPQFAVRETMEPIRSALLGAEPRNSAAS